MPCDISNVKIGPCYVELDGESVGVTKGGVVLSISTDKRMLNDSHFGTTTSDGVITKRSVTVKIPFAESTLENLKQALPDSVLTVNVDKKRLDVYDGEGGVALRASAVELVLKPVGSSDPNDYVTIPNAITDGNFSFIYEVSKERVFEAEFTALNDSNRRLMFFGDATA